MTEMGWGRRAVASRSTQRLVKTDSGHDRQILHLKKHPGVKQDNARVKGESMFNAKEKKPRCCGQPTKPPRRVHCPLLSSPLESGAVLARRTNQDRE